MSARVSLEHLLRQDRACLLCFRAPSAVNVTLTKSEMAKPFPLCNTAHFLKHCFPILFERERTSSAASLPERLGWAGAPAQVAGDPSTSRSSGVGSWVSKGAGHFPVDRSVPSSSQSVPCVCHVSCCCRKPGPVASCLPSPPGNAGVKKKVEFLRSHLSTERLCLAFERNFMTLFPKLLIVPWILGLGMAVVWGCNVYFCSSLQGARELITPLTSRGRES